eukprot:scaffold17636_cov120-Isochrysis_galbana.AAC.4
MREGGPRGSPRPAGSAPVSPHCPSASATHPGKFWRTSLRSGDISGRVVGITSPLRGECDPPRPLTPSGQCCLTKRSTGLDICSHSPLLSEST